MVKKTFADYPYTKIIILFVTLMSVYNSVIEHYGDNFYKILHLNKDKMEIEGILPRELQLSAEATLEQFHCDIHSPTLMLSWMISSMMIY